MKSSLVPNPLVLKVGAQVMLLKNYPDMKLANGSRGVVSGFDERGLPLVTFMDGTSLCVEYHTKTTSAKRVIVERHDGE